MVRAAVEIRLLRYALRALVVLTLSVCAQVLHAQTVDWLSGRIIPEAVFAIGDSDFSTGSDGTKSPIYQTGAKITASVDFAVLPFLSPSVQGGFMLIQTNNERRDSLSVVNGGAGISFITDILETLRARIEAFGGVYSASIAQSGSSGGSSGSVTQGWNFYAGGRGEIGLRFSPAISLALDVALSNYFGSRDPLITGLSAGLSLRIDVSGLGSDGRVKLDDAKVQQIFPVQYSYYKDNAFGSIDLKNDEGSSIRDVKVSFTSRQYMDQAAVCATFPILGAGASKSIPLYALFNDQVLSLTEESTVSGEVVVDYKLFGAPRQVRKTVTLDVLNRNSMTWSDDRKAAAFVSPTDPAALWFSKSVASIVRDRLRGDINPNLQYAAGLFEAERLFGINYVVDPSSSFVTNSASDDVPDYLQFAHQTLLYRGGDCDDLSILFSTLLESIGVHTAFITIPGHIFMAFSLDMTEEQAKKDFAEPSILIYRNGQAWLPVEITLVKDGFVKAWRIGAKEWYDNAKTGAGNFYPMADSWKIYRSVGIPNVNPRFSLPSDLATIQAFDETMDRYVAREIEPTVKKYRDLMAKGETPENMNELGIVYGRNGMLKEAWDQFTKAAKANSADAWTNLASIAFLRKDYGLAKSYYIWALSLRKDDTAAILGLARTNYELERFDDAEVAYGNLNSLDPILAEKYPYLSSMFGGEGRAWSFADRLTKTTWDSQAFRDEAKAYLAALNKTSLPSVSPSPTPQIATLVPVESPRPASTASPGPTLEQPALAETAPSVTNELGIKPEPSPDASAQVAVVVTQVVQPSPSPETRAQPVIQDKLPEDADLAALKSPANASIQPNPSPTPQSSAGTAAPAIQDKPPEDADLAAMKSPVIAAVQPEPSPSPSPELSLSPAPVAVAQTSAEPTATEPSSTEPVVVTETSTTVAETVTTAPVTTEPAVTQPAVVEIPQVSDESPRVAVAETQKTPTAAELNADDPKAQSVLRREGFAGSKSVRGSWQISGDTASQTASQIDGNQFFAKMLVPVSQADAALRYSFEVRSAGKGWVGAGVHIAVQPGSNQGGFGGGKSILVWLTVDPTHYGDKKTHLQIYRSLGEVEMKIDQDLVIPESLSAGCKVDIEFDPVAGTLNVFVDNSLRLAARGYSDYRSGVELVLRSLDRADFKNLRVEEMR